MNQKQIRDLPTAQQLERELKQLKQKRSFSATLRSTLSSLIVVLAVAVLISNLLMPVLRVTGTSMTPTLQNDEIILCSSILGYEKGDIVAFHYNNKVLLKRVIGTAGDIIDITADGTVFVNGEPLDEPYVSERLRIRPMKPQQTEMFPTQRMRPPHRQHLPNRLQQPLRRLTTVPMILKSGAWSFTHHPA